MISIIKFMSPTEADAYGHAASLSAANTKDRTAWVAGVVALHAAQDRLIETFVGPVRLNRFGLPSGGLHPAIANVGYLPFNGCYEA